MRQMKIELIEKEVFDLKKLSSEDQKKYNDFLEKMSYLPKPHQLNETVFLILL